MSVFSEMLVKRRKEKGWTQEQLSKLCDVSQQAISKIEAEMRSPSESTMTMIASAFNLSLSEFLEYPKAPAVKPYNAVVDSIERQLLSDFRKLNKQGREYIRQTMDMAIARYGGNE